MAGAVQELESAIELNSSVRNMPQRTHSTQESKQFKQTEIVYEEKQSAQQRKINETGSCWNCCKTDNLAMLQSVEIDFGRGALGENILHIAMLFKSNKCAKYLCHHHPQLAMQVYEGDEYFGESVLHMAIATDNVEILDFLLSSEMQTVSDFDLNVLINDIRAIGHFFHPKYGTVDFGHHALTFAVALNQKETVLKLLRHGASLNCIDDEGRNPFHFITVSDDLVQIFQAIVAFVEEQANETLKREMEELLLARNQYGFTPLQYAVQLKNPIIFNAILDYKKRTCWQWGPVSFIAYPLNEIDTHGMNKNSVLETILADNVLQFIELPVIQAVLEAKWNFYARNYFIVWCLLHVVYVIGLLVLYSLFADPEITPETETALQIGITIWTAIKLLISTVQIVTDIKALCDEHGTKRGLDIYLQWNLPELSIIEFWHFLLLASNICIVAVWITMFSSYTDATFLCLSLSFISESLYTLYFAQYWQNVGRLVISILRIITGDMPRFLAVFLVIIFGFSGALGFLYPSMRFDRAALSLFYISLGVGEYWDDGSLELRPWQSTLNKALYVFYLLIALVLLFNLLIAIFSETIEEIGSSSRLHWNFQRASTILLIERRIDKPCLRRFYTRVGKTAQHYAFDVEHAEELYFIAFEVIDQQLSVPKNRPKMGKMSQDLNRLKAQHAFPH